MADRPDFTGLDLGASPIYDNPQLALNNLLSGNLSGAGRAIYDPASLSPTERQTLASRLGIENSALAGILNVATNPVFLGGLVLSLLAKKPQLAERLAFQGGDMKLAKRFGWMKFTSPAQEVLRGTPLVDYFQAITNQQVKVVSPYTRRLVEAFEKYRGVVGRDASPAELQTLPHLLEDTFSPENEIWATLKGRLRKLTKVKNPTQAARLAQFVQGTGMSPEQALDLVDANLAKVGASRALLSKQTPAMQTLVKDVGEVFDSAFFENYSDPEIARHILSIQAKREGFPELTLEEFKKKNWLRKRDKYYPHQRHFSPEDQFEGNREVAKRFLSKAHQTDRAPSSSFESHAVMLPTPEVLKQAGFSDDFLRLADFLAPVDKNNRPMYYTTDFFKTVRSYFESIGQAHAWHVPPKLPDGTRAKVAYGDRVKSVLAELKEKHGVEGLNAARLAEDVVIPHMMGGLSDKELRRTAQWAESKSKMIGFLHGMKEKVGDPGGVLTKLQDWMSTDPSSSWPGIGHSITRALTVSTLGFPNVVSPMINALQPVVSSGLPQKYLTQGYGEAARQISATLQARLEGKTLHEAFKAAAPDFADEFLTLDPKLTEKMGDIMDTGLFRKLAGTAPTTWTRRMSELLMGPFKGSETLNRLAVFNGYRKWAADELLGTEQFLRAKGERVLLPKNANDATSRMFLNDAASQMTLQTMFGSGPLNKPIGMAEAWSPWQQFTTYPLNMVSLLANNMRRDPAWLGQALMMSGGIYSIGKEAYGADYSRQLLFGGLPAPSESGPFAPLPIVPPALQLVGATGISLASGDSTELRKSLPLLVPGGVGLSRIVGTIPGAGKVVGPVLEKQYADYQNPTPDGRIPVYTSQGSLVGYFSQAQLWGKALGLGQMTQDKEARLTKFLMGQRDSIRAMRKEYLEAMYQNDTLSMTRLQSQYEKRYPGMGGIPVRDSDIRALHLRHDVSRIERIMETIPPELRPQMTQAVATAFGANYEELLGLAEGGLSQGGTIQLREPYRAIPREDAAARMAQSMHGVKLRDRIRMRGHERTRQVADYGSAGPYQVLPDTLENDGGY